MSLPLNYLPYDEISLIHAAILKRDIQLVELILDLVKPDVDQRDQLLKEAIKVKSNFLKRPKKFENNFSIVLKIAGKKNLFCQNTWEIFQILWPSPIPKHGFSHTRIRGNLVYIVSLNKG